MQDNIKLTREQTFCLIFIGVFGNIVYSHTWIDNDTDRSSWVAALCGILLIIPLALWILYLGKRYPKATIFDILEIGMGRFVTKLASVVFIFINIAIAISQLNMFTEMLKVFFLQFTPSSVILIILVFISFLFVNSGLLVLTRLVELLMVLGLLNYFTSFSFTFMQNIHVQYILPIFDTSIFAFLKGTIFIAGAGSECILLLMIIVPLIPDPMKHCRWVFSGILFSSIILSLSIMLIIGIMSPELAKRIAFGGVNASKVLQMGEYIRGLEIFVFGTYQFIAIGKTCLCLYCAWICAKKTFNNWKPNVELVLLAISILIPSVLLNSYNKAYFIAVFMSNYVLLPFSIIILSLATIGIVIKNLRIGGD